MVVACYYKCCVTFEIINIAPLEEKKMVRVQVVYFETVPQVEREEGMAAKRFYDMKEILSEVSNGLVENFSVTARVYEKVGVKYSTLTEVELCFNVCEEVQMAFLEALRAVVKEEPTTRSLVKFQKKVRYTRRF